MKNVLAVAILTIGSLAYAQQTPAPSTPQPAAPALVDTNIDPTAETDDPTLLKAQILIISNAQEVYRGHMTALEDFQKYESYADLKQKKIEKLQGIVQAQAQAKRMADINKTKVTAANQTTQRDAEMAQLAAANKAKAEAAAKKTAPPAVAK